MTHFPLMAENHPDFDQSTLPSIPSDWVDTSWVNELCPSFEIPGKGLRVWIDYPDQDMREVPGFGRFMVTKEINGEYFADYVEPTDDWSVILEACNNV